MGYKPRVLIAEDDPDTLVILRVNLNAAGFEPILASDGHTALARIEAEQPDAVLLDVLLPGIDGWQVLEALHAMGDPVPVIMCSAKDNIHDLKKAQGLGAVAYLVKPFDIDRLVDVTTEVVGLRVAEPAEGTVTDADLA
jgi:two-component system KDP operon response regulator KdpE